MGGCLFMEEMDEEEMKMDEVDEGNDTRMSTVPLTVAVSEDRLL